MAFSVPSWLAPGDFLGASRAGASLGQQRRQADQQAALAAQRIAQDAAQAYAQMAQRKQELDAAEKRADVASQLAKDKMDRDYSLDEQKQAVQAAQHQATLGMEKAKLEQDAKQAAASLSSLDAYRKAMAARVPASETAAGFETVTEKFPAVEASPAIPGRPKGTGLLGTGLFAKDAIPAQPAIPASPARTVSRKVAVGSTGKKRFVFNPDSGDLEPVGQTPDDSE